MCTLGESGSFRGCMAVSCLRTLFRCLCFSSGYHKPSRGYIFKNPNTAHTVQEKPLRLEKDLHLPILASDLPSPFAAEIPMLVGVGHSTHIS